MSIDKQLLPCGECGTKSLEIDDDGEVFCNNCDTKEPNTMKKQEKDNLDNATPFGSRSKSRREK